MKDLHKLLDGYYDASLTDDEELFLEEKMRGRVTIEKKDEEARIIASIASNNILSSPTILTFDNMLSRRKVDVKRRLYIRIIPYAAVVALLMIVGSMALSLHNEQKKMEQEILNNAINKFCHVINQSDSTLNSVASVLAITLDNEVDSNIINDN